MTKQEKMLNRAMKGLKDIARGEGLEAASTAQTALFAVERIRVRKEPVLKSCEAEIWHGPGHQTRSTCDMKGPHKQHSWRGELFWSKKKAYSGFFDQSPEDEK